MEDFMNRLYAGTVVKVILILLVTSLVVPGLVYAQQRLSVKVSIANLRSGPGTKYDVLWQVEQYHPVLVIEKEGNWYKIKDFENDVAWVHRSLLSTVPGVITIKEKCNIRADSTTKSSVRFKAERGVPFKVLEKKRDWLKVEHVDGDIGWIYKTLVW